MTSSSDRDAFTEAWYRERAEAFADRTRDMAMAKFHDDFLARLPDGGRILDVGCGSGRDAKAFRERGYEVEGLERSPELARMAEQHAGCPVRIMSMEELEDDGRFDGLWASASVLHIPIEARAGLLTRFLRGHGSVETACSASERQSTRRTACSCCNLRSASGVRWATSG